MSTFVESLKRLYKAGKVTQKKLKELVKKGTITQADYDYIVG